MSALAYSVIDAFTSKPFGGNPAAVVVLEQSHGLTDATLQGIALEFNLSETAFITKTSASDTFGLRWFTPAVEVRLCGHATLASAFHLFSRGIVPNSVETIKFETRWSGILTARRVPETQQIELDFPAGELQTVSELDNQTVKDAVSRAIGAQASDPIVLGYGKESYEGYGLVKIDPGVDLKTLKVDVSHFTNLSPVSIVILTNSSSSKQVDYCIRVFAPAFGIDEDPVTGSAHSFTAPYWSQQLNSSELQAIQPSARGGELVTVWDQEKGRVKLRGNARIAADGKIFL